MTDVTETFINPRLEDVDLAWRRQPSAELYYRGAVYDMTGVVGVTPVSGPGYRVEEGDIYIDGSLRVAAIDVSKDVFELTILGGRFSWPVVVGGREDEDFAFELVPRGCAPTVPIAEIPFEALAPDMARDLLSQAPRRAGTTVYPKKHQSKQSKQSKQTKQDEPMSSPPTGKTALPPFEADYTALYARLEQERQAAAHASMTAQATAEAALNQAAQRAAEVDDPEEFIALQNELEQAEAAVSTAAAAAEAARIAARTDQIATDARRQLEAERAQATQATQAAQLAEVSGAADALRASLAALLPTHYTLVRSIIAETGYELTSPESGERYQPDEEDEQPPVPGGAQDDEDDGRDPDAGDEDAAGGDEGEDEDGSGEQPTDEQGKGDGDQGDEGDTFNEKSASDKKHDTIGDLLARLDAQIAAMQNGQGGNGDEDSDSVVAEQVSSGSGASTSGTLGVDVDAMNAALAAVLDAK